MQYIKTINEQLCLLKKQVDLYESQLRALSKDSLSQPKIAAANSVKTFSDGSLPVQTTKKQKTLGLPKVPFKILQTKEEIDVETEDDQSTQEI